MLAFDLASNHTMEFGLSNFVHEATANFNVTQWLLKYNVTEVDIRSDNLTRHDFDFSDFDLEALLEDLGILDLFKAELNYPDYEIDSLEVNNILKVNFGDEPLYQNQWETHSMLETIIDYINNWEHGKES